MRTHEITSVCHGGHGVEKLYRRDGEGLTEGITRKLDIVKVRKIIVVNTRRLTRKIDARDVHTAEFFEIFIKRVLSDSGGKLHKDGVAGILQSLFEGLGAVTADLMAVDRFGPARNAHASRAVKRIVFGHFSLFKRDGGRDKLESRARLVGITDTLVSPHFIQQILFFFR